MVKNGVFMENPVGKLAKTAFLYFKIQLTVHS